MDRDVQPPAIRHRSRHARWLPAPLAWLLGYRGIRMLARRTFRYDLISQILFALAVGVMVPDLTQLMMSKGFEAGFWMIALLQSQHALGNLIGAWAGQYLQNTSRVRIVVWARLITAVFIAAIALLPLEPGYAWPFVALLMGPSILNGLVLSTRNALRHANYPARSQGRIYGRLIVFHLACLAIGIQIDGWVLDAVDQGHRLLYVVSAGLFVASALVFGRIRPRRERSLLSRNGDSPEAKLTGFSALAILVRDRLYGRYMLLQMISGAAVMMAHPAIAMLLAEPEYFNMNYSAATSLRTALTFGVALLLTVPAGLLFDHIAVSRYRGINAMAWSLSRVAFFLAAWMLSPQWLMVAFILQGMGQASGGVVFNVGHTRFSHAGNSQLYMSAHLILQGIRGISVPFLGAWLFATSGIGEGMFLIAAGMQMLTLIGFMTMPEPSVNQDGNPAGC